MKNPAGMTADEMRRELAKVGKCPECPTYTCDDDDWDCISCWRDTPDDDVRKAYTIRWRESVIDIPVSPEAHEYLTSWFPDAPEGVLDVDDVIDALSGYEIDSGEILDLVTSLAAKGIEEFAPYLDETGELDRVKNYKQQHQALHELVSHFMSDTGMLSSNAPITELLKWSFERSRLPHERSKS